MVAGAVCVYSQTVCRWNGDTMQKSAGGTIQARGAHSSRPNQEHQSISVGHRRIANRLGIHSSSICARAHGAHICWGWGSGACVKEKAHGGVELGSAWFHREGEVWWERRRCAGKY